ncbi:hypothetical protein CIB95_04755 [Lottiidibacillus patelloidae]|uniref:Sodium:proton antiporter n=1 Tax=Lottiidibacillus patelloidae TaxID=2670334 RepID=A0A263BVD3_9BACI|nr:hypothetical protein [Lottiidibacillus patelloidae]OZM57684.1 hypothetical protein CIB95_04755 [Lottiidibacillus patelloidae]
MSMIVRLFIVAISGYFLYQKRYKVLNALMSIRGIRQIIVSLTMRIPGVREKFIHQAFRAM